MRLFILSMLVAVSSPLPAGARPFASINNPTDMLRRGVSYSVVPVDGGQSSTSEAATKTEIRTIVESASAPLTKTIISTVLPSESESITTVLVTASPSVFQSERTSLITPPPTPPSTSPPQLSTPASYDDGMWHTTYAFYNQTRQRKRGLTSAEAPKKILEGIPERQVDPALQSSVALRLLQVVIDVDRTGPDVVRTLTVLVSPATQTQPHTVPRLPTASTEFINPTKIRTVMYTSDEHRPPRPLSSIARNDPRTYHLA
ncbi:MAG: hypothetical protein M1824_005123 [Vezdaea acicularis]|nr:MAG: hypothetical protein M1824_005123 [Vezdaea acicularis]